MQGTSCQRHDDPEGLTHLFTNSLTTPTARARHYLWLPTPTGPMPIATVENTTTFQAITADHLNTPRRVTSADGTLLWQWPYSAFGDEQPTVAAKRFASVPAVEGQFEFNLRYPGQYFDKESGLHYNEFRTYDPVTGRYTQGDPIGLDGGWNRFAYVGGNPLLYVDPEGLVRIYDNGNVTIHANPGVPIGGTEHARHGPGENYHVHVYDSQNREARISTETWRPLTPEDEKIYNSSKVMQKACEGLNDSEKNSSIELIVRYFIEVPLP